MKTAINATTGAITVYVDSSVAAAHVPAATGVTNCFGAVKLAAYNDNASDVLTIDDGATLSRLDSILGSLNVQCACVTTAAFTFAAAAPFDTLTLNGGGRSAQINVLAGATVPAISLAAGQALALITNNALINSAVAGVGIIALAGAGAQLTWEANNSLFAAQNTVSGAAGTTVAFLHDLGSTLPTFSLFTGTTIEQVLEPQSSVIYRPGTASTGGPSFAVPTWLEVQARITAAAGQITVYVDSSLSSPAQVPASSGTTDCLGAVTFAAFNQALNFGTGVNADVLLIKDTAVLKRPKAFVGNLTVNCECTTTSAISFPVVAPNGDNLTLNGVDQSLSMVLTSLAGATKPIIQIPANGALILTTSNIVWTNPSLTAIIDLGPSGQFFWFATDFLQVTNSSFNAPAGSTSIVDFVHDLHSTLPTVLLGLPATVSVNVLVSEPTDAIIYRPGFSSLGNASKAVPSWKEVQSYIAAASGAMTVYIDCVNVTPAQVPASSGITDCQGAVTFAAYNQGFTAGANTEVLLIKDTAVLKRPKAFVGNLTVNCECTTTSALTFNPSGSPTDIFEMLGVGFNAPAKLVVLPGATKPVIQLGAAQALELVTSNAAFDSTGAAVGVIDLGANGNLAWEATLGLTIPIISVKAPGGSTASLFFAHDLQVTYPTFSLGATVIVTLAVTEPPAAIVYRPGFTSTGGENVAVPTWLEVQSYIAAASGAMTLYVDGSLTGGTAIVPASAGVTDCKGAVTVRPYNQSQATPTVLHLTNTAVLLRPRAIVGNMTVECECVTTDAIRFNAAAPFDEFTLSGDGLFPAVISVVAGATVAAIQIAANASIRLATRDGALDSAVPGVGIISLGAAASIVWAADGGLRAAQNVISGAAGTGVSFLHNLENTLPTFTLFAGTTTESLTETPSDVIYRPGSVSTGGAGAVQTWASVQAYLSAASGALTVFVDDSITSPALVPAGSGITDFKMAGTIAGYQSKLGNQNILLVKDTAVLNRVRSFQNLQVNLESITVSPLTYTTTGPFDIPILDNVADLALVAGAAVPAISFGAAGAELVIVAKTDSSLNNASAPGTPFVNCTAGTLVFLGFSASSVSTTSSTPPTTSVFKVAAGATFVFEGDDSIAIPLVFTGVVPAPITNRISQAAALVNAWTDNAAATAAIGAGVKTIVVSKAFTPQVTGKVRVTVTGQISTGVANNFVLFLTTGPGVTAPTDYQFATLSMPAGGPGSIQPFGVVVEYDVAAPGGGSPLPHTFTVGVAATINVVLQPAAAQPAGAIAAHGVQLSIEEVFQTS